MKRRKFIGWSFLLGPAGFLPANNSLTEGNKERLPEEPKESDRAYRVNLLDKIASPVLGNMSRGELKRNVQMEFSPAWNGRNNQVRHDL